MLITKAIEVSQLSGIVGNASILNQKAIQNTKNGKEKSKKKERVREMRIEEMTTTRREMTIIKEEDKNSNSTFKIDL
jgi:hypothetical protein